MAFGLQLLD